MTRELEVLAELARRSARIEPGPRDDAELRRLGLAWRRRQRRKVGMVSVALVAASAAALALFYVGRSGAPLTYEVDGDVAFAGRRVEVHGEAARLSFSDGTRFELARATRAELGAVDERGAQLRLHGGRAHLAVVHKPRARWSVAAGPFTVRVVGTVFDVSWSAADEVLEVSLIEGAVAVEGPLPQLPLNVRAGQQLLVRAREGQLRIAPIETLVKEVAVAAPAPDLTERDTPLRPSARPHRPAVATRRAEARVDRAVADPAEASGERAAAASSQGAVGERAAVASPQGAGSSPAARRGGGWEGASQPAASPSPAPSPPPSLTPPPVDVPPPRPTWPARVAAGAYAAVLEEALAEGLPHVHGNRSSDDLAALSDAARYLGRRDLARDAFLAQRRRFPAGENARRAAFHLGVLAEESSAPAEAVRFYDLYLAEAPAGSYAPEALGRKMLAIERQAGAAAARPLAEAYRRQFAQGPYLVHALRILQAR